MAGILLDRKQKMIPHSIHNLPFCPATGYLIEPPTIAVNNKVYTRQFLLAYRTVPQRKFRRDPINPVDPASIICTCSFCSPEKRPIPEIKKTIVACALPLPSIPSHRTNKAWKPMPKKPYVYWSTRRTNCVFQLKWLQRVNDPGAKIDYYELFFYREIPGKTYTNNTTPWKFLRNLKKPRTNLGNFRHGGLYHYAVRCVDVHGRRGPFGDPVSLFLTVN